MPSSHAVIIDDQPSNIDVLAMLLSQEGISHTGITSRRDVLPTIEALDRIDVVFLDLEMPNGDYYLTLHELKQQPSLTGVPIVAYTVHTSEIDKARQAGFDGFLGKPLKATEFPGHLQRILGREPVWVY